MAKGIETIQARREKLAEQIKAKELAYTQLRTSIGAKSAGSALQNEPYGDQNRAADMQRLCEIENETNGLQIELDALNDILSKEKEVAGRAEAQQALPELKRLAARQQKLCDEVGDSLSKFMASMKELQAVTVTGSALSETVKRWSPEALAPEHALADLNAFGLLSNIRRSIECLNNFSMGHKALEAIVKRLD